MIIDYWLLTQPGRRVARFIPYHGVVLLSLFCDLQEASNSIHKEGGSDLSLGRKSLLLRATPLLRGASMSPLMSTSMLTSEDLSHGNNDVNIQN